MAVARSLSSQTSATSGITARQSRRSFRQSGDCMPNHAAANPARAFWLQSLPPVRRVAELLSLGGVRDVMRNSRSVFCGIVIGIILIVVLVGVVTSDWRPVLWGVGAIVLACCAGALLNLVIFPPLFRLLARLTGKPRGPHSKTTDDHAA